MDILAFHLRGKMAHFRKYYSNSSALSYWVPPRTTITGIIAGLLGMERDSYYEQFSLHECKVALALCSPLKKTMQKMNLLMIKSSNDLNGSADYHSQTATEFIIPMDLVNGYLDYRVFIHHKNIAIQTDLCKLLSPDNQSFYCSKGIAFALGSAQNLGWIETDRVYQGEPLPGAEEKCHISTVVAVRDLTHLELVTDITHSYLKEDLPLEFDSRRNLTAKGKGEFIINANGTGIWGSADKLVQLDNGEVIAWMQ
ncbi:MAG TPA: CRISPR-associated protein Cas5 [Clostridiales bacterium]|jgi:CRISPR-associated protein Cas5h|nr:CRISPR-associated protein Cas5 [Clostridiales bacterium]